MALNGISTLSTKQLRQEAKLALAQTKRQAAGTPGYRTNNVLEMSLLPSVYVGDVSVDNPNIGGLVPGRPWITSTEPFIDNLKFEDGSNLLIDNGFLILE